ncbi:hypothetical protein ABKN59_004076 [Abortiporus biennis]
MPSSGLEITLSVYVSELHYPRRGSITWDRRQQKYLALSMEQEHMEHQSSDFGFLQPSPLLTDRITRHGAERPIVVPGHILRHSNSTK